MGKHTLTNLLVKLQPLDEEDKIDLLIQRMLKNDIDFAYAKVKIQTKIHQSDLKRYFIDTWNALDLDDIIDYQREKKERQEVQKEAIQSQKGDSGNLAKGIISNPRAKRRKSKDKKAGGPRIIKLKSKYEPYSDKKKKNKKKKRSSKEPFVKIIYVPQGGKVR